MIVRLEDKVYKLGKWIKDLYHTCNVYFCVVYVEYKESKTRSKVKRSEIKNQYRIINKQMKRNVQINLDKMCHMF